MLARKNRTSVLVFFVNGKKVVEEGADPEWTLLYYLRVKLSLCGTKLGCGEGGCGACTVMISKYDGNTNKVIHVAANACLTPLCAMHGLSVTTVEGIGSTKTRLHPVQERIAKAHGSQCGFCTPGIVMSMYSLLRTLPKPTMHDLEVAFQGNLCRCTGYRPIIEGYRTFTEEWEVLQNGYGLGNGCATKDERSKLENGNGCAMGVNCCKLQNGFEDAKEVLFQKSEFTPYDSTQEPIFPPELKLTDVYNRETLVFKSKTVIWYRPTSLKELLRLKHNHPDAKLIVGNTEVGVEMKFKNLHYPVLIHPVRIAELTEIGLTEKGVRVGASVTVQDMQGFLKQTVETRPKHQTRIFVAIVEMLHWFAGKQVRNVAAVGGNIMTGSPISDLNPIFLAAKVTLELLSEADGARTVVMDDTFFTGYRRNVVKPNEILVAINIPFTTENQYFFAYKQARRRDDDIAIVNHALDVTFQNNSINIERINLAFGGMAPTTITAQKTKQQLIGLPWTQTTLETAFDLLLEDLPLSPSAPGGMIQYRRSLTLSLFFRAFLAVAEHLQDKTTDIKIHPREYSAIRGFPNKTPRSSQYFQVVPHSQGKTDGVGRPKVHQSAYKQATGEAVYCDDMPSLQGELYMGVVYSQKAHAKIVKIDASDALLMEGVYGFFCAKDIPKARNKTGPVFHDDEVFVSDTVTAQGQVIGVVVADTQLIAQKAVKRVQVVYEDLQPVIVTIEDAIEHKSYMPGYPKKFENGGDVDEVFGRAPHVLEGSCRMGGQEHFYLETQCVFCVPKKEDDELEVFCSTQHPTEVSKLISEALGVPQNKIITKVKRMGGGFGGKESKAATLAVPCALVALKLNRPVRCMLDRDEDIVITGGRHPFYFRYKVAFDDQGKILAFEVHIYNNCGYSHDLSLAVLDRAVFHCENSYKYPCVRIFAYACKTNIHSNTAFRGFGGPQGMFVAESMIRHVADYLNRDVVDISELNLYKEGDLTHYNQKLEYCTLQKCWSECLESSDYYHRKKSIQSFNRMNRYKKRGISVIPTKFGIAFTLPFLNQGGALILVYTDGSVLLSHGGTEMGQGLHTKMIQVASRALEIPMERIHISETSTDKVPNTSPTAASSGSDINGMAVLEACEKIKKRLQPYKDKNPKGKWEDWVQAAYFDRVSLSATGFHATPGLGFSWDTIAGNAFNYFTYGVAVSEVEIDCLTGDHQVLRTDIVMDLGESINPAIDIGQIEGGFVQGYGLFVLEEMVYSPAGTVFTRGPGTYKIPGFADIPAEFNVSLLKGAPNPRAVYSSKAVGEPPLFLASSILFAIREAIKEARKEVGLNPSFTLSAPATAAKIRMACQDHITAKLDEPQPGSYVPWNVIP